jgi:hypothetical protein
VLERDAAGQERRHPEQLGLRPEGGQDLPEDDGRAEAELDHLEQRPVGVDRQRLGGVGGPAAGQHEHQVEGAQRVQRPEQHGHQEDRPEQRERDPREPGQPTRPVHLGRLVEVGRDADQPGVGQDGDERQRPPHVGRHHRRQGQRGVAEPVDPRAAEEDVHDAGRRVVEPLEHPGRDRGRHGPGQEQQGEAQPAAAALAGQRQRHQEPEDRLQRHRGQREEQRGPEGGQEPCVAGQELVVAQAGRARDVEDRHALLEREPEHPQHRVGRDQGQHEERRHHQQAGLPAGGALPRGHRRVARK